MGKWCGQHPALSFSENISRTSEGVIAESCGYVIAEAEGGLPRFCDAPTVRGSSYCVRHRALCQVAPGSAAAAQIAAELASVHLGAPDLVAIPEPLDDAVDEALAEFDLPPRERDPDDES
jgi:hypothetical protein